ncbi:MAG: hypothetical protein QOH92_1869 [Chloroflexota bacterium]|jgi:hypothetical protein|nr:hypothetical protein [Chloroflexota bacterium]
MVWQVGVLLVGVGFLVLSLFASFTLLNMTRSLRTIESILSLTLDEARLALPELRHSLQQIDDMVSGVNDKFTAADRAMNATSAAIGGWRDRVRDAFGGIGRRKSSAGQHREEA